MDDDILERDELGAFTRHTHVAIEGSGKGPLAGLTFGVKDIYDIEGHKTGFGSPDWLRTHDAATKTAPIVRQLLDAGADMVGKTHTDELTFSLHGENHHYGTPQNANAPGRICGGSSSGSASAVAGGLVHFAIGSDTGGSVRAPASLTGIYGLRPTHGRVSLEGARPLAASFDVAGWFAREPDIMETVGCVLFGESRDSTLPRRVLIADDAFEIAGHAATAALQPGVDRVTALIGKSSRVCVSNEGLAQWLDVFRTLQGFEAWAEHGKWVNETNPDLGPGVRQRIQWASTIPESETGLARKKRDNITERVRSLLREDAVLVLPTVPDIAPLCGADPKTTEDFRARSLTLLCIAGLARLPQINLPLGRLNGAPIGLSLIGPKHSDMMLLGVAKRLTAA